MHRLQLVGASALLLIGCAQPRGPGYQIDVADRIGAPLAVMELEVPAAALKEGETARFDIEFQVDMQGRVQGSSVKASTRPDLNQQILEQHKHWIYAVAPRARPCLAQTFAGTQQIEFARHSDKLAMQLYGARVDRALERLASEWAYSKASLKPESARMPEYTRLALIDGVQETVGVMFDFGPDGKASNVRPINFDGDRWGLMRQAVEAVSSWELRNPPGRTIHACHEFKFTLQ
jgi:outer membrane biosynthesis protein TonB